MRRTVVASFAALLLLLLFLPCPAHLSAHAIPTHENISRAAVDYLTNFFNPEFDRVRDLVDDGAAAEDTLPRPLLHFTPRLNDGFCGASHSSIEWGFTPGIRADYRILGRIDPLAGNLDNHFTWADALNNGGADLGWVDVGYVLHLLEDLSSPAHVRNDCHPPWDSDDFEELNNGATIPELTSSADLKVFSTPEEYLSNLAGHTRTHFFSKDTVFDPDQIGPVATSEDRNYFYDSRGRRIAYKSAKYRETLNLRDAQLDRRIVREQFDEVASLTVLYAASLLCHYARAVGAPAGGCAPAVNDSYTVFQDATLHVTAPGVLSNDAIPSGFQSVEFLNIPAGSFTNLCGGGFSFTPNPGVTGTILFRYVIHTPLGDSNVATVTVQVEAAPPPPVAPVARDDTFTMTQGTTLTVPAPGVLANDTVPSGVTASVEFIPPFPPGDLTNLGDGGFVLDFASNQTFTGTAMLSYVIHSAVGDSNLATINIQVNPASPSLTGRFTQITDTVGAVGRSAPVISRDGSIIAFVQINPLLIRDGGPIFTTHSHGTNLQQVTPAGLIADSPFSSVDAISFDGQRLVFPGRLDDGNSFSDLYIVNADGSDLRQLTAGRNVSSPPHPVISSDGSTIAFRKFTGSDFRWMLINADGTSERDLPVPPEVLPRFVENVSLSADASRVAVAYLLDQFTPRIGVMNIDGTGFQQVTEGVGTFLAMSGDGETITFGHTDSTELVRSDGTGRVTLQPWCFGGSSGRRSAVFDGSVIAYETSCVSPGGVFLINADGTDRVSVSPEGGFSAISENGSAIVFESSADLDPGRNTDLNAEIFVALLRPSLSVNDATGSRRPQGEMFLFSGFGFTPNQPLTRRVRQPDGSEVILDPPMLADADGRISWTFQSTEATPFGTYLVWVIDDVTGQISNIVYETVIPVLQ